MKLYIPGPTQVHPSVLQSLSRPMISHRSAEASNLQLGISTALQKLMYTSNTMVLSSSSGTGLMEAAIRSFTNKKAIVFSVGAFGKRWAHLAKLQNIPFDLHEEIAGNANRAETVDKYLRTGAYDVLCLTHNETSSGIMNPIGEISEVLKKYPEVVFMVDTVSSLGGTKIEVDKLGIDICISSSQKCLALPPGLAIASVSEKAKNRSAAIGARGWYLDFNTLLKFEQEDHQYLATPSLSLMFAMDFQLKRILAEGLENRFARHKQMATYMLNWCNEHFSQFAEKHYESDTLTVIKNTLNLNFNLLDKYLQSREMLIANGYGELKDKTFRIAHMGELQLADMHQICEAIEQFIKSK